MPLRTSDLRDPVRAAYLARKAAESLAIDDREAARERYREALGCDPDDDEIRFALARLEATDGDPTLAAALLVEGIERRPAHPEAWNLLGVLLFEGGDPDAAATCWRRCLAISPGLKAAKRNLRRRRETSPSRPGPGVLAGETRERLLMRRPVRVTAFLIVRDEAELLAGCLDSLAGAVDDVVVVDTGSTDATPEIARARGAVVVRHAWADDFARARNEALRHVRGDWVLMIDADEHLRKGDAAELRRFTTVGHHDYAKVAIDSVVDGEVLTTHGVRLFRNYPGLRYIGRIHEQILPTIQDIGVRFPVREGSVTARLEHVGYDAARFVSRRKGERNARLLDAEVRENPGNAYARLKHGELLFVQGRLDAATKSIDEAWKVTLHAVVAGLDASVLEEPATLRAACAVARGDAETALETLARFHEVAPPTANTLYLEGVALWQLGRSGARARLCEALEAPPTRGEFFTLPEVRGASPRYLLGAIALDETDPAEARRWFEEALSLDGDHREARLGLAEAQFRLGAPERAVAVLAEIVRDDPRELRAWRAGAVYLLSGPGMDAAARAWLEAAWAACAGDAILARLRGDLDGRTGAAAPSLG